MNTHSNIDEKQVLDDCMMNIRPSRDELNLYMQGYCTINGKVVIRLNQRGQGSIKHTSLGFSLDDNGELVMHLIEDNTCSDIIEPMKVPNDFSESWEMYNLLQKGLETLWQYEGGFFFKKDDAKTQWNLYELMYENMKDGLSRGNADDILFSGADRNANAEDFNGSFAMEALDPTNFLSDFAKEGTIYARVNKRRQAYKNKLYASI